MAAVTICSDFRAPQNKVCHCFHCFPIYLLSDAKKQSFNFYIMRIFWWQKITFLWALWGFRLQKITNIYFWSGSKDQCNSVLLGLLRKTVRSHQTISACWDQFKDSIIFCKYLCRTCYLSVSIGPYMYYSLTLKHSVMWYHRYFQFIGKESEVQCGQVVP